MFSVWKMVCFKTQRLSQQQAIPQVMVIALPWKYSLFLQHYCITSTKKVVWSGFYWAEECRKHTESLKLYWLSDHVINAALSLAMSESSGRSGDAIHPSPLAIPDIWQANKNLAMVVLPCAGDVIYPSSATQGPGLRGGYQTFLLCAGDAIYPSSATQGPAWPSRRLPYRSRHFSRVLVMHYTHPAFEEATI